MAKAVGACFFNFPVSRVFFCLVFAITIRINTVFGEMNVTPGSDNGRENSSLVEFSSY